MNPVGSKGCTPRVPDVKFESVLSGHFNHRLTQDVGIVRRLDVIDLGLTDTVTHDDGLHSLGDPAVLRYVNQWPDKGHEFFSCPGHRLI